MWEKYSKSSRNILDCFSSSQNFVTLPICIWSWSQLLMPQLWMYAVAEEWRWLTKIVSISLSDLNKLAEAIMGWRRINCFSSRYMQQQRARATQVVNPGPYCAYRRHISHRASDSPVLRYGRGPAPPNFQIRKSPHSPMKTWCRNVVPYTAFPCSLRAATLPILLCAITSVFHSTDQ